MPIYTDPSVNPYAYSNSYTSTPASESRAAEMSEPRSVQSANEERNEQTPADRAIIASMSTQIIENNMRTQNAQSGISMVQTADGASESISQNIQRMSELAVQAQNGTLTSAQREVLNVEYQQNMESLNSMANNTEFNGQRLLNNERASMDIAASESSTTVTLPDMTSAGLSIADTNIANAEDAMAAMESLTAAMESIGTARAEFGAQQNGLQATAEANITQTQNTQQARSQIRDEDMAQQVSDQVRRRIQDDAQIMMQAQANQNRGAVLQVLDTAN